MAVILLTAEAEMIPTSSTEATEEIVSLIVMG